MTRWIARSIRAFTSEGGPPELPDARHEAAAIDALRRAGLLALASEFDTLRSRDAARRPSVFRALAAGTDVDVVRLHPGASELEAASGGQLLDYAGAIELARDEVLAPDAIALPPELLAVLLQPIVAGLLVDEGCARDLGTAEPIVLARSAAALVDPRIDAALELRPLVLTHAGRLVAAHAERGAHAGIGAALADALGLTTRATVGVHLPLGERAIEEAARLLSRLVPRL